MTAREHDILLRLARGRTNGEIAADLISERHRRGDGHANKVTRERQPGVRILIAAVGSRGDCSASSFP